MARIRTIKPEFFRHEALYEAERVTGLPLRLAFAGLWTAADREGRFRWSARQLKLDCLPYDDVDFSRVLDALMTRGFIVKYAIDGREYGHIPSWHQHQVINNREKASDLPEPSEINMLTRDERVDDASITPLESAQVERKGKEGKGREGKGIENSARGRRLPEGATITGPDLAYAISKGLTDVEAGELWDRMATWAWSSSGSNARKVDWHRAFQGWVQRDAARIVASRNRVSGRPLTAYQQSKQETRDILNGLENFASGSGPSGQTNPRLLPGDTRERSQGLRSGTGPAFDDIPAIDCFAGE